MNDAPPTDDPRFSGVPLRNAQVESLRLPPHSVEAEQAVLGGLLLSNTAFDRVVDVIEARDFYRHDHRLIFSAITRQIEENRPADVLSIAEILKQTGEATEIGGLTYLHQLAAGTPSSANVRHYAEIVRERAQMRALIEAATIILDRAYAPGLKRANALMDEAQAILLAATHQRKGGEVRTIKGFLAEVMEQLDERHRNPQTVTGKATGFVDLDEKTAGLHDGNLIVIAGRPSMGKTAIAMNIAEHIALEEKRPVMVFTMEMAGTEIASRLLGSVAKVDSHRLRTGRLDAADWERMGAANGKLDNAPIVIDDTPGLSALELRARARRKAREFGGLGLVVIDYLQLMESASDGRNDNRATEIGDISRSMKTMAKELGCPVIMLSQLNRSLEARVNKRPVMSDLRDSGAIEQDADLILFVYRDEVYNPESPNKGLAEIIIGKQRNGALDTVYLTFIGKHTRFENYSGQVAYGQPTARTARKSLG